MNGYKDQVDALAGSIDTIDEEDEIDEELTNIDEDEKIGVMYIPGLENIGDSFAPMEEEEANTRAEEEEADGGRRNRWRRKKSKEEVDEPAAEEPAVKEPTPEEPTPESPEEIVEQEISEKEALTSYIQRAQNQLMSLYKSPKFQSSKARFLKLLLTVSRTVVKYIQGVPGFHWVSKKTWPVIKPALKGLKELAHFIERVTKFLMEDPFVGKIANKLKSIVNYLYNLAHKIVRFMTKVLRNRWYRQEVRETMSSMSRGELRGAIWHFFKEAGQE